MKKKIIMIWLIFDIEKWLWKSEFCYIWPSIPNQTEYLEPFYGPFHRPLVLLLTTKLNYVQLFKGGHSNKYERILHTTYLDFSIFDKRLLLFLDNYMIHIMGREEIIFFSFLFLFFFFFEKHWVNSFLLLGNSFFLIFLQKINSFFY